jgi:hypothetical protein
MRRAMFVVVFSFCVAVGVMAPIASAHTSSVSADCNGATFNYINFSNDSGGHGTQTIYVNNVMVYQNTGFFWGDLSNVQKNPAAWDNFSDTVPYPGGPLTGNNTVRVTITNLFGNDGSGPWPGSDQTFQLSCGSPPPPAVCTYTKGFYRNHADVVANILNGGTIPLGNANLNAAQVQQVLDAKPGQPGKVTWSPSNDVLNLAQQILTAELNGLRGASPPQPAIDAGNASLTVGTSGGGVQIAGDTNAGTLLNPLDSFNSSNDCP